MTCRGVSELFGPNVVAIEKSEKIKCNVRGGASGAQEGAVQAVNCENIGLPKHWSADDVVSKL